MADRKKPEQPLLPPDAGKLPPQAPDVEQVVLGQVLLESGCLSEVSGFLTEAQFYVHAHRLIYEAIMQQSDAGEPINIVTIVQRLKRNETLDIVGGPFYIAQLTNKVASGTNVEYHGRIILQKYLLREIARVGSAAWTEGMDDSNDPLEEIERLQSSLASLQDMITSGKKGDIARAVKQVFADYDSKDSPAIPTGITALDNITQGGFRPTEMIVLAARPGMGKTSLAISMQEVMSVAAGRPTAMLNFEMGEVLLTQRMMAQGAGVPSELIRTRSLSDNDLVRLQTYGSKLMASPVHMVEAAGMTITQLIATIERLAKKGIQVFFVDHIGLPTVPSMRKGSNRENEVGEISRRLKGVAARLNVTIVALSQLSRAVETRGGDKRPSLADLRDSGSIEQDADMVIFIWRAEYYGIPADIPGLTELIIAKQRNGTTGTVHCHFNPSTTAFTSTAHGSDHAPF